MKRKFLEGDVWQLRIVRKEITFLEVDAGDGSEFPYTDTKLVDGEMETAEDWYGIPVPVSLPYALDGAELLVKRGEVVDVVALNLRDKTIAKRIRRRIGTEPWRPGNLGFFRRH